MVNTGKAAMVYTGGSYGVYRGAAMVYTGEEQP